MSQAIKGKNFIPQLQHSLSASVRDCDSTAHKKREADAFKNGESHAKISSDRGGRRKMSNGGMGKVLLQRAVNVGEKDNNQQSPRQQEKSNRYRKGGWQREGRIDGGRLLFTKHQKEGCVIYGALGGKCEGGIKA